MCNPWDKGMKRVWIYGLLLAFCLPVAAQGSKVVQDTLTYEDRRKFDYFFLEALRLKQNAKHSEAFQALSYALKVNPTSSAALYEISNYYLFLEQDSLAVEALKKAVQYDNTNFEYKMALANTTREFGRLDESIAIYNELVKENPGKPELYYYLSDIYTRKGNIPEAIRSLDALEESMGMNEAISLQKFRLYSSIEQQENAFKEVEKLAVKYPMEPKYQIILGDLYLEQKKPEQALLRYQKAHEIDPQNPYYVVSMANYYEYQQDNEAAEKEIDTALRSPKLDVDTKIQILGRYIQMLIQNKKNMDVVNSLFKTLMEQHSQEKELNMMYGQFLLSQKKIEEAKFQFQVVTEASPDNRMAWLQLLKISISENNPDEVIKVCDAALIHFQDASEFYFYKGAAYYQKKEYRQALDTYLKGLEVIPPEDQQMLSDFYGQIGDLYYHVKEKKKAYEAYDKALDINENNIVVLNNYAYFLTLDKTDLDKAERMSAKCVKIQPNNSTYIDTYAWVFFTKGMYTLAKFYIESAMSQDEEKSAEIMDHYGDILFKTGDVEKAVEQWKKALEIKEKESDPDTEILKKKIADKTYYENEPEK